MRRFLNLLSSQIPFLALTGLILCLVNDASFAKPPSPDLYETLGVNREISPQALDQQFELFKIKNQNQPKTLAAGIYAYRFLSDPDLRNAYDHGNLDDLKIAPEARPDLIEGLEAINPSAAQRLKRTGLAKLETLSNVGTFYLVMGLIALKKCHDTQDPLYCTEFLEGLKEPQGISGFLAFMGAAHLTEKGAGKIFTDKALAQSMGGYAGMIAGSFVSNLVGEVYEMPEVKEWLTSSNIADETKRKARRKELRRSIFQQTLGNPLWYRNQIPELASMIAAAAVSQKVSQGFSFLTQHSLQKITPSVKSGIAPGTTEHQLRCGGRAILQKIILGEGLNNSFKRWSHRRVAEASQIYLFMGVQNIISPPIEAVWDHLILDQELTKSRNHLLHRDGVSTSEISPIAQSPNLERPKNLEAALNENLALWEDYRMRQMKPVQELMSVHRKDWDHFWAERVRTEKVYQWMLNGANPEGEEWDQLVTEYGQQNVLVNSINPIPADQRSEYATKKTLSAIEPVIRGFFTGVEAAAAFHESQSKGGIPNPLALRAKVEPYRIDYTLNEKIAAESPRELKKRLSSQDYSEVEAVAYRAEIIHAGNLGLGGKDSVYLKKLAQTHAMYQWMMKGSPSAGSEWKTVQSAFASSGKTPTELRALSAAYLNAFFKGDRIDFDHFPDLGSGIAGYRVDRTLNEKIQHESVTELLKRVQNHPPLIDQYHNEIENAGATLDPIASRASQARLNAYEDRQEVAILKILKAKDQTGILTSLETEISELSELQGQPRFSEIDKAIVQKKIVGLQIEKLEITRLIQRFETPRQQRNVPRYHVNDVVKNKEDSQKAWDEVWQKAIQYYQQYRFDHL